MNLSQPHKFQVTTHSTYELARTIWDKLPQGPSVWKRVEGSDFNTFYHHFSSSILVVLTDFGYIRVEQVNTSCDAIIHALFWNKEVFSNIRTLRDIGDFLCKNLQVKKLFVPVPKESFSVKRLLRKIGLLRNYDIKLYTVTDSGYIPRECWEWLGDT